MRARSPSRALLRGFGLVELLISMSIGLVVALAVGEIYLGMRRGEHTLNRLSDLQERSRFISERLKRDIRMAGFLGGSSQKWSLLRTSDASFRLAEPATKECFGAGDAGVSFRWAAAMEPLSSGESPPRIFGSDGAAPFGSCIDSDLIAASDVLSVHFAGPTALAASALQGPNYYVQSSLRRVFGFYCSGSKSGNACLPGDIPAATGSTEYYPLVSRAYYVRSWARSKGDDIPTLVAAELHGDAVEVQPLVEGVAAFQVLYGLDNDSDGQIDGYRSASEIGDLSLGNIRSWNSIKTVAVTYLLRSEEPDVSSLSSAAREFTIGDSKYTVEGRYQARLYKITAAVRNPGIPAGGS